MAQTATININVNSKEAQANADKLSQSINNAGKSSQSLKTELRQLTQELQGLAPGSERFQELSQKAGQLRDQIQDTNAVINATAGNVTENLGKGLQSTLSIGVAGFQALTAAQSIFGTENEDLNKTIVKLQAAMNLSMAIETFGGLGDKLTAIKASFMGLAQTLGIVTVAQQATAVAATEAAVAEGAEAIAADGAAVSTGAFAVSLNALPLVAIVTALGLLVAGLITYANSSSNAAEKDKKRKEELEKSKKTQEEYNAKIKESSDLFAGQISGFVSLTSQIKASLPGSKERLSLIKQSNATYGTTIKNLKDEKLFQDQVTKSVSDYIAFARVKFRLQANEKAIEAEFSKQETTIAKLSGSLGILNAAQKAYITNFARQVQAGKEVVGNLNILDAGFLQQGKQFQILQNDVFDYLGSVRISNNVIEGYGSTINSLNKEINSTSNALFKSVDAGNQHTNSIQNNIDVNDKYASLLDDVKNKIEREVSVFEKSEKFRTERINGIEKETESINKLYSDERQSIIDKALKNELDALDIKFKKEGKTEEQYLNAAKVIRDNYQTYLLESEKKLLEQLDIYQKEDIQNVQDTYTTKEKIVLETTQNILTNTKLLQIQFEKQEAIRVIDESGKTEEEKNKAKLEVRKKYAQQEIVLLQKNLEEQKNLAKFNLDETLSDESKTFAEKEQAQATYDQNIIKAAQETANKINDINEGVKSPLPINEDNLTKSLEEISKYVDAVASLFNQLSTTLTMINDVRTANEEMAIEGRYDFEKDALDNQLAEGIIGREEFDNKIKELDQQKEQETLQLKRKEFQTNKRLNITNAIINGAQAVLSTFAGTPGGPIIKGVAAGIAAIFAATQVGVISSQEFVAAGGGIVPGMGSGNVDTVPSRLAPGETVINTQSSQMYPELLNSINMAGGGISLKPDLPAINKVNSNVEFFGDNKVDKPIRAYVVETDVTDTQKRINRIKQSSEF